MTGNGGIENRHQIEVNEYEIPVNIGTLSNQHRETARLPIHTPNPVLSNN